MPVKSINKIKIGNYPQGQFAGGYIYSFQVNQGFAESVNELKIDIVYDKNFDIKLPEKSLTNSYRIEIGDIIIPYAFLIKHSKSISATENIISCTFIDSSFILDRYYIGLTNRHGKVDRVKTNFNVNVYCQTTNSAGDVNITPTQGVVSRLAASSPPADGNGNGGLIILGKEKFTEQACDVPDVEYLFSDLWDTLKNKSILDPSSDYPNSKDPNTYTGTLREVLSSWGSDLGFSFYWDFLRNTLVIIDLRSAIDISPVQTFIENNFNSNSNLNITNYSEEESLEGTYFQAGVNYALKPARSKERPIKEFLPMDYSCVKLQQANIRANTITSVLAKYNRQAWLLYNLQLGNFSTVGFFYKYNGIEQYLLERCFSNVNEFLNGPGTTARLSLGYYDENIGTANADLEARNCDDIGRYYINGTIYNFKELTCQDNYIFQYSTNFEPQPIWSRPFASAGGNYVPPLPNKTWYIERNPAWDEQGEVDLQNLGPIITQIEGDLADQVRDTIILNNPNDINPDRYRGLTMLCWKPYLSVGGGSAYNKAEEEWVPAQYTKEEEGCKTKCDKNLTDEICGKVNGGWSLTTPAHGLVSKLAGIVTITNFINRTSKTINLPSEQPYIGYITTDGSFGWVEEGSVSVKGGEAPPSNVMSYNVAANDVTEPTPSVGQIVAKDPDPALTVSQTNEKKQISLKVIGAEYGQLADFLSPDYGLTNFNIYINDNGIFTDLSFENRPNRPKGNGTMRTVGPHKMKFTY
jgi:hypothetical protein